MRAGGRNFERPGGGDSLEFRPGTLRDANVGDTSTCLGPGAVRTAVSPRRATPRPRLDGASGG